LPALPFETATWRWILGSVDDNVLEATTIGLGAITAVLLAAVPPLTIAVVPCVLLLERGALVKQLESIVETDAKTDLLNAAGWQHAAELLLARAAASRPGQNVGALMIDLDHFKRVNDQHGHLAGDAVLRAVAQTIAAQVRSSDIVGRFGGEEFVVLAPVPSSAELLATAERIRSATAELSVPLATGETISGISVSIGVASAAAEGIGTEDLLRAADKAMYLAKRQGRNLVRAVEAA
jgi:diguanylate cyclase (GGDEF)-like protein